MLNIKIKISEKNQLNSKWKFFLFIHKNLKNILF